MQKMNFEFIVSFKNFYEDESNCYLTMEFVRGLELFDVKRDIGFKKIKAKFKISFYINLFRVFHEKQNSILYWLSCAYFGIYSFD